MVYDEYNGYSCYFTNSSGIDTGIYIDIDIYIYVLVFIHIPIFFNNIKYDSQYLSHML